MLRRLCKTIRCASPRGRPGKPAQCLPLEIWRALLGYKGQNKAPAEAGAKVVRWEAGLAAGTCLHRVTDVLDKATGHRINLPRLHFAGQIEDRDDALAGDRDPGLTVR